MNSINHKALLLGLFFAMAVPVSSSFGAQRTPSSEMPEVEVVVQLDSASKCEQVRAIMIVSGLIDSETDCSEYQQANANGTTKSYDFHFETARSAVSESSPLSPTDCEISSRALLTSTKNDATLQSLRAYCVPTLGQPGKQDLVIDSRDRRNAS